ncbi:unnamed protein product [Effrenium voratum]|nr:unnamed protein product [Effrenium voratum]
MPAGTQTSELKEIALETGVTAVMLSRLSPRVTVAKLLSALDENARDLYDFVYLPQDKRKHRNVGLAFVNFANHETALRAAEYFMANSLEQGLWSNVVVGKANIQGLQSNLAYFVARCGLEALDNANAPLVFEGGVPVAHIREAIRKHVSVAMILEAQTKIKVEKTNSKSETSGMFAGPKEMASAWKSKSVETIWKSGFQAPPGLKGAFLQPGRYCNLSSGLTCRTQHAVARGLGLRACGRTPRSNVPRGRQAHRDLGRSHEPHVVPRRDFGPPRRTHCQSPPRPCRAASRTDGPRTRDGSDQGVKFARIGAQTVSRLAVGCFGDVAASEITLFFVFFVGGVRSELCRRFARILAKDPV